MIRESRLIGYRASQYGFDNANTIKIRDRQLQREADYRKQTVQQTSNLARNSVADMNKRYAGLGTNFNVRPDSTGRGFQIVETTPADSSGVKKVISRSSLGALTDYQKKLEAKYAPLLAERAKKRGELQAQYDKEVSDEQKAGFSGAQAGYKYSEMINNYDQETAAIKEGYSTAEQPTPTGSTASTGTAGTPGTTTSGLPGAVTGSSGTPSGGTSAASSITGTGASGSSVSDIPSLAELTKEEKDAILPILTSLRQKKANVKKMAGAESALFDQRQGQIDTFTQNANAANDAIYAEKKAEALRNMDYESELAEESLQRQRRDEELAQQEVDRDFQRLEQKQIDDNLKEQVRVRTALGARYGGFGSSKGMQILQESLREGDRFVREIVEDRIHAQKEHRNKLADLETTHRSTVRDIMVRHDNAVSKALQEALTAAVGIDETQLNEEGEQIDSAKTLIEKVFTDINDIEEKTGSELAKANQAAMTRRDSLKAEAKKDSETKKKDALDFYGYVLDKWGNSNPQALTNAVNRLRDAGYDVTGLDTATPTIEQLQKLKDSKNASMTDPFRFTDARSQQIMASALNITSKLPVTSQPAIQNYVSGLLDQGKTEEAYNYLKSIAVKQFGDTQQTAFSSRNTIIQSSQSLITDLKAIQKKNPRIANDLYKGLQKLNPADFNEYSKGLQSLKNKFALDKNPEMQQIFARIENIAGVIINERYGAAVTDGEMDRARQYIAMSGNTLNDMITKLDEFQKISQTENENLIDSEMGVVPDYGPPPVYGPGEEPDFNTEFDMQFDTSPASTEYKTTNITPKDFVATTIDSRTVRGQRPLLSALEQADRDYFNATGEHIAINQDIRDSAYQAQLYENYKSGKGGRAAPPGKSFHEKGLAVDVTNWKQAEPSLRRYGLANELPDDRGHFSIGEFTHIASTNTRA